MYDLSSFHTVTFYLSTAFAAAGLCFVMAEAVSSFWRDA